MEADTATEKDILKAFDGTLKMSTGKSTMERATNLLINGSCDGEAVGSGVPRYTLLPHLFKIKGQPFSLYDYPQFQSLYQKQYAPDLLLLCGRQVSKSLPLRDLHKISLANGSPLTLDKLRVGTEVICVDDQERSTISSIAEVFNSGVKDILEIRTRMGRILRTSKEHRLRTLHGYTPAQDLEVGTRLAAARQGGVFNNDSTVCAARVRLTAYMIGDGHMSETNGVGFTTGNADVRDDFCKNAESQSYLLSEYRSNIWRVGFRRTQEIQKWLREDGLLNCTSLTKFIPTWAWSLSKHDTASFIEALWATDGLIKQSSNGPTVTYTSISRELIDGLRSLLLKFGIAATVATREAGYRNCEGTYIRCNDAHVLRVEGRDSQQAFMDNFKVPGKPPITIPPATNSNRDTLPIEINDTLAELFNSKTHIRGNSLRTHGLRMKAKYPLSLAKQDKYLTYAKSIDLDGTDAYKKLYNLRHGDLMWDEIVSIEELPPEPCFDIEVVDHHNFLLDGIVSHNSTNLSRSETMDAIQIPNFQQLYVAPLQSQSQRYSTLYLAEAIKSCTPASQLQNEYYAQFLDDSFKGDIGIKRSVMHQTFLNGSSIMMSYAKSDSDRARGITADRIDFDEIQDQLVDNLPIISESLSNSSWGCRRFTGTAKTNDNTIEYLWRKSSQSEWVVRCKGCTHWNIPNVEHDVLKMVGIKGPICAKCGKALDVRHGEFVSAYPDRWDEFQGVRVGQIVVPALTENPVKWANIVRKIANLPEATVLNEIFGISCDFGVRLISQSDLDAVSNLGTHDELYERRYDYVYRVIGVDWGIAEVTSFTVVSVMGVTPQGELHCLYGHRYVGVNVEEIIPDICNLYAKWDAQYCAPDFGVGYLNNTMLANRGLNVVQCQYVTQNKFMSPREQHGITVWTVDRNTALGTVFHNIRNGKLRFANPEDSADYVKDMLSPYEELVEQSSGIVRKKFLRAPDLPDDFCHATTFACMALWYLTGDPMLHTVPEHHAQQDIESQMIDGGYDAGDSYDDATDIQALMDIQAAKR